MKRLIFTYWAMQVPTYVGDGDYCNVNGAGAHDGYVQCDYAAPTSAPFEDPADAWGAGAQSAPVSILD